MKVEKLTSFVQLLAVENAVLFVILAPFDNEQSDLIQRVFLEAEEVDTPVYRQVFAG
jgi:26S proteasome regulatory subunit N5